MEWFTNLDTATQVALIVCVTAWCLGVLWAYVRDEDRSSLERRENNRLSHDTINKGR